MKVAIVGNSNCVFAKGFAAGVRECVERHDGKVDNYSLGGSCCAMHIYTLHDRYAELQEQDVVIIDSLVIDTFHYKRGIILQGELLSLIDDMYALYSRLPGKVVSVLFPIEMHVGDYESLATYRAHKESAKKYGVDVLDVYKLLPVGQSDYSRFFFQPSHIRLDIASEIGSRLMESCMGFIGERGRCGDGMSLDTPYQIIKGDEFDGLESVHVKSSHYSQTCYRLDKAISMNRYAGKSLVGALHWNKENISKFVCFSEGRHDVVLFRSQYAFFEVLNARRKLGPGTTIRPGCVEENTTQHAAGSSCGGDFGIPHLAGLLLRDDKAVIAPVPGVNALLNEHLCLAIG